MFLREQRTESCACAVRSKAERKCLRSTDVEHITRLVNIATGSCKVKQSELGSKVVIK